MLHSTGFHLVAGLLAVLLCGCADVAHRKADGIAVVPIHTARADSLALKILDGEALYTMVGGLKPMSTGIWSTKFSDQGAPPREIEEVRAALALLCRDSRWHGDVLVFKEQHGGEIFAEAYVIHRAALRGIISRRLSFFSLAGISPGTPPDEVVRTIEALPPAQRLRGYGYLFGYPCYAVDFFCDAAQSERRTGIRVERDFVQVPTYSAPGGRFVWAVPKGHVLNREDQLIRRRAAEILNEYQQRREAQVALDGTGAAALLKSWLDEQAGSSIELLVNVESSGR